MGDHEMADRDPVALLLDGHPWMSPWRSVLLDGGLDARPVTLDCCTKDGLGAHK